MDSTPATRVIQIGIHGHPGVKSIAVTFGRPAKIYLKAIPAPIYVLGFEDFRNFRSE
jgi:hypothetical protein